MTKCTRTPVWITLSRYVLHIYYLSGVMVQQTACVNQWVALDTCGEK